MNKIIIIAEAGVNHNGSVKNAKKLIDIAKSSGADFIKFQSFTAKNLVTKNAKKSKYQLQNIKNAKNKYQFEMLKKLELNKGNFIDLMNYSKKLKIGFLASPFDIESIKFLKLCNLKYIKIPSGEITNLPYLKEIAKNKFKVFLSTGMSNMKEIKEAIKILLSFGAKKNSIYLLHCNTEYPTPYKDVNLNVLHTFKKEFKFNFGYSDHTIGDHISVAAIAMGAKVIEKHITTNKDLKGPDHSTSMSPKEFKLFVKKIRELEISFGSFNKQATSSEKNNIKNVRKSIYAKNTIKKGEKFNEDNLCCKRPFVKISPMQIEKIYGKKANKNYSKDELIDINL